jgi:hypothetical protein
MSRGSPAAIIAITDETPRLNPIGTLNNNSITKLINNIDETDILFRLL